MNKKKISYWIEKHLLPDWEHYYGDYHNEKYEQKNLYKKCRYWIHNWPGFHFGIGNVSVAFLEFFEGHPGDRVYINTKRWHICFAPLSKIQKYDLKTHKFLRESSWYQIFPQNFREFKNNNK